MEAMDNNADFSDVESRTTLCSEVDEVDNLSTNQNKPTDREMDEEENEDNASTVSHDDMPKMSAELETAHKILSDLMSDSKKAVNWPFMASVEETAPELYAEYRKRIEKPMWLRMMQEKFDKREYQTITEFVSDFRLMLENCYRFNGPDHYISKRGQKLETMLEQKLALLSRELRERTSIEATSGSKNNINNSPGSGMRRRQKNVIPHDSTSLLNQLREQEQQKVREWRKKQILDRKAEKEALAQEILDWEESVLFSGKYMEHMKAMWEIPQIGLFLFLCQVPLNIGEVMHFELERCFLIPRESSTMQLVMTSLLSTPFQRLKIDKKSLMPYKVWEYKLRMKVQLWYKAYVDNDFDTEKAWLKTGVDEKFFEIVGTKNPLEKKRFHQLTFYKKVWIVKSLCDYCLQTQDSLRETIEQQPFADQREYLLGTDADGKRYIHFPQFCGADVRVYRQAPIKYPKLEIKPDPFDNKRKFPLVYKPPPCKKMRLGNKKKKVEKSEKPSPQPSPSRQRPSRLRQSVKPVIPLQLGDSATSTDSNSSDEDSDEESDSPQMEMDETGDCKSIANDSVNVDIADSVINDGDKNDLIDNMEEDKSLDDRLSSASDVTVAYGDNSDNSSVSSHDYSRESSPFLSTDLRLRRSARLDKFSDTSRETSPMIYDSDNGLSRSGRSRTRLKTQTYKASRNLTNMLIDENSTASNSSAFGEPNMSGILTERLLNNANLNVNSTSSETGEESVDCDIHKLFTTTGTESNQDSNQSGKHHTNLTDGDIVCGDSNKGDNNLLEKSQNGPESSSMNGDISCTVKEISHPDTDKQAFSNMFVSSVTDIPNGDVTKRESSSCNTASHVGDKSGCTLDHQDTCLTKEVNKSIEGSISKGSNCKDGNLLTEHVEGLTKSNTGNSPSNTIPDNTCIDTVPVCNKGDSVDNQTSDTEIEKSSTCSMNHFHTENGNTKDQVIDSHRTDITTLTNGDIEMRTDNGKHNSPSDVKDLTDKIKQEPDIKEEMDDFKDDSVHGISSDMDTKLTANNTIGAIQPHLKQTLNDEIGMAQVIVKVEPNVKEETEIETNIKEETNPIKEEDAELSEKQKAIGEVPKPESEDEEEEEEEEEIVPDLNEFELLADSVEDLRKLTTLFEEPEPIVIRKGKKEQISRPPPRKKCVVHLHERLQFLLKELEPWEGRLVHATKRARIRIRKEVEDYVEPPETEDSAWNSTDEETESGVSDDDADKSTKDGEEGKDTLDGTVKFRTNTILGKQSRENNSGTSTPVKLDDIDDIDVSQRGRLRKRRIIPNNAEDQIAPKKLKPKLETTTTTQDTPTVSQPIIIQSGKSQMVDYSDILRQLKIVNSKGALPPGVNPVLIKTTQGGRTLLTSVLPLNKSANINAGSATQKLQNIRLISPVALQQQLSGQNFSLSLPLSTSSSGTTKKISQHPTIENLLTGNVTGMPPGGKEVLNSTVSGSTIQILPHTVKSEPTLSQSSQPGEKALLTPVKTVQTGTVLITPEKTINQDQITPQKLVINQNITPRKIAPYPLTPTGAAMKGTVKYYAANASTLPINVVQQLLATRGAKLQTGPNQQSILYIPMESDGDIRNVAPVTGKYVASIPQTKSVTTVIDSQVKLSTASITVSSQGSVALSTKSKSPVTSNLPILPKPASMLSTSPVFNVSIPMMAVPIQPGTSVSSISPNQGGGASKTVKTIFQSRLAASGIALNPTSPPRYPTNETVRTLLDKRKFVDEKSVGPVEGIHTTYTCIASQLQRPCPSTMTSSVMLKKMAASAESQTNSVTTAATTMTGFRTTTTESAGQCSSVQQHVITSISPAKLNTLLLQTSAAGAKTIPTMIKLPSKAVLESAVKAVVTSVPTSIPTINMKVPSPTTLPSIGPRRNVTKTVQTMKSPIPVAPKVVTQNSGMTTLSVADSQGLLSTQSTPSSSQIGISTTMSAPPNTAPVKAHLATFVENSDGKKVLTKLPAPVNTSLEPGVRVGYLTQQGYVIPKLQPNMGNQSASAILNQLGLQSQVKQEQTGTQSSTAGMQLVQNAQGLLQLVPKVSPQTQTSTCKSPLLQMGPSPNTAMITAQLGKKGLPTKQVVAINAQGKHIIVKQKMSTSQPQSTDQSTILSKTDFKTPSTLPTLAAQPQTAGISTALKPAVIGQNLDLKSPGTNYILPHTVSGVINPLQSPTVSQPAFSPLLNMQQVLLPGAGFQLASPVINPVGLNLLQSSLPPQSPTIIQPGQNVQTSQPSLAGQPVVNINQALLNQALLSNISQHQLKVTPAVNFSTSKPVLLPSGTVLDHPLLHKEAQIVHSKDAGTNVHQTGEGMHVTVKPNPHRKTPESPVGSMLVSGSVTGSSSLTLPNLSQTSPGGPMVVQYAIPPQGIVSPTLKQSFPSQTATVTTGAVPRQLFMNYAFEKSFPTSQTSVQSSHAKAPQTLESHTSKMVVDVSCTSNSKPADPPLASKPTQSNQKLLLYSIGGQLVTGQGVPVTLHQGVLKVMPQGKLQIANQTLTPEQIKQTLAKIGGTTVPGEPGTTGTGQSVIGGLTLGTQPTSQTALSGLTLGRQQPGQTALGGLTLGTQPTSQTALGGLNIGTQPTSQTALSGLTLGTQQPGQTALSGLTLGTQQSGQTALSGLTLGTQQPGQTALSGLTLGTQPTSQTALGGLTLGTQLTGQTALTGLTIGTQPTGQTALGGLNIGTQPTGQTALGGLNIGTQQPGHLALGGLILGTQKQPGQTSLAGLTLGSQQPGQTVLSGLTMGTQPPGQTALGGLNLGTSQPIAGLTIGTSHIGQSTFSGQNIGTSNNGQQAFGGLTINTPHTGQTVIGGLTSPTQAKDPVMVFVNQQEKSLHSNQARKPSFPAIVADASAMDHAYQHKQRTSIVSARVKRVTSTNTASNADIKLEPVGDTAKSDIVLKGASSNSVYIMKPMTCSAGYTVFPSSIKSEELQPTNSIPIVRTVDLPSKGQGQREVTIPAKLIKIEGPTPSQMQSIVRKTVLDVNGKGENSASDVRQSRIHSDGRLNSMETEDCDDDDDIEDDDDDDGNHLIIDDSANEKEAALNLLTLANQALGPRSGVKK